MENVLTFPGANNSPSKENTYTVHSINHTESPGKHKEAASAELAQNILENSHKLHAQGAIDTTTFNKCIHMFSALASGIVHTEPEPPIAS